MEIDQTLNQLIPQTPKNIKTMKLRAATSILTMLAITFTLGVSSVKAGEFEEALDHLEHAKWSEKDWHPERAIEQLEIAKHRLEDAIHSHHGERHEAIHQIDKALEAARGHEFHRVNEHIEAAIHDVREGLRH
jgi:type I site-specific restriction endonuclease